MKYSFVILLLLCACRHELKNGKIVQMHIEPERTYMYMMPIPHTMSTGKTTSTYFTYIPMMMHDDEDYTIRMHGFTEKGEEKDETFYVSKSTYDKLKLGQDFCVSEDCSKNANKDRKAD
jgi:hypothetical protein